MAVAGPTVYFLTACCLALCFLTVCSWSQQATPGTLAPPGAVPTAQPASPSIAASTAAPAAIPDAPQAQPSQATPPQDTPLPGQPPTAAGSISGAVKGQDGSVYQGVRVTLTANGPHAPPPQTQATDPNGAFHFAPVPPGPFRLSFTSTGFATQTVSGILRPGQSYTAPTVVLPVANTSNSVHVSASQGEIAQAQLNIEEKQRVLGVIPNYYVTYDPHAAPLTTRQKYQLAWKSSIDPVTWAATGIFAGIEQADNTFADYGQGAQGYAKRFGAGYADTFIGTMLGGAVLPSIWKQDPRYFYKGTGSVSSRVWYSFYNSVMCKGDNGHWQVNYSSIIGSLAAGGISNLYYPASDRDGAALTFESAGLGIASSIVQNLFQEFLIKKLTPTARAK